LILADNNLDSQGGIESKFYGENYPSGDEKQQYITVIKTGFTGEGISYTRVIIKLNIPTKYGLIKETKLERLNDVDYKKFKQILLGEKANLYEVNLVVKSFDGAILLNYGKPYVNAKVSYSYTRNAVIYPDNKMAYIIITVFK